MIPAKTPVVDLGLSIRATAALRLSGLHTFGEVAALTAAQLCALPNFSRACFEELVGVAVAKSKAADLPAFVDRGALLRQLERAVVFYTNECQRLGDEWALAQAELELAATRVEALRAGGDA